LFGVRGAAVLSLAACASSAAALGPDRVSCRSISQASGAVLESHGYPHARDLSASRSYVFYACSDGASYYVGAGAPTISSVSLSYLGTSEITADLPHTSLVDIDLLQRSGPRRVVHTTDPKHPTVTFAPLRVVATIPFIYRVAGIHRFRFVLVVDGAPLRPGRYSIRVTSLNFSTPSLPVVFDVTPAGQMRVVRLKA
jgi:hypothetical protein